MKSILVAVALMVGCGGSKPAPSAQPANTEPAPAGDGSGSGAATDGSGAGSAAAAGSCEAAGGQCMAMQAAISCSARPEGACPQNHFCCKL